VYWSYLTAATMVIGLHWWLRRPASRFGPLLVLYGSITWLTSWQAANAPLAFDTGLLAEAPFFVLTIYVFLAFPMDRVEPPSARWLGTASGTCSAAWPRSAAGSRSRPARAAARACRGAVPV
jgi:hypothetical protein